MELSDRVVNDFYDEQYCDLCETTRHPENGVYYCDGCRCAAHIDCVIPEVYLERRKLAEDRMLRQLDEAIATVEAETEQVKKEGEKKLELLMTKLVGLKTKKHKIEMQAEAEQDRV
ncbi:hypothetical protein CRG98_030449 [Punica granatum]|uniref:DC1 domain-containing protein n=1 Tax=Punica granatum TaxID=22663 RepID=A0A2I0IYU6_PUNGR|nr:hypothetical protein CRG98_030449 [Punica granatum]